MIALTGSWSSDSLVRPQLSLLNWLNLAQPICNSEISPDLARSSGMGYARMKRTSVPPTVWLALAVLYSASLVAASHFTNPPYPDTVKGELPLSTADL